MNDTSISFNNYLHDEIINKRQKFYCFRTIIQLTQNIQNLKAYKTCPLSAKYDFCPSTNRPECNKVHKNTF